MSENEAYVGTETFEDGKPCKHNSLQEQSTHTYEEALDLAGNGCYNYLLLATLSMATLSMAVDIFGFSVIVSGAGCDFNLGVKETGILLSVTFIGPILMAYPWGYLSDTQGRKKSLIISLWTSFLISSASSFSTNWTTLAVLKLISTSFSSCAQYTTCTLLGESCTRRYRDVYMLIMASILDVSLAVYVVIAYFVLNMEFAYGMGFITFTPWRLLSLLLSMITGLAAIGTLFLYESPKFLLNYGRNREALDALTGIWTINGRKHEFPVKNIILNEIGNDKLQKYSVWRSFWEQLIPIFKPPLLWRSLQLYFIAAVVYGTNNGYFIWLPYLGELLIKNKKSNVTHEQLNICSLIGSVNRTNGIESCTTKMDISLVWFSIIQGASFVLMMSCIARIAHRKRFLIITVLLISSLTGLGAVLIRDMTTSFLMFLGVLANQLVIGIICSYFVELYPTSYRGMASCLCTMVARSSAVGGVSVIGTLLLNSCSSSFYLSSALMISGVLVALFLPRDKDRPKA